MDPGAGAVEPHRELERLGRDGEDPGTGTGRRDLNSLEPQPLECRERSGHLARRLGELAAARQLAIRLQRRLLPVRSVEAADPSRLQTELDDLLERARLVLAVLAVTDRGDEIREPAA